MHALAGVSAPQRGGRGPLNAVLLCAAAVVMLAGGVFASQRAVRPVQPDGGSQSGPLFTLATPLDDGRQMLLLVDQQTRTLAIYHVDPAAGTLTLKSTRDVRWDLMVEDFNCQEPRPASLKKMLEMPK